MSAKDFRTLLGAGELPAFFPESPSRKQSSQNLETSAWIDQISPGPPAHWKKGRAVGRVIQTSETAHLSVVNGFGKVVYPDSSVYVGTMKDRARDGEGCFQYADGGEYLGQWLGGKKHGVGVMIFASGARYAGEWVNGMRQGYGIYFWHTLTDAQQHIRSPSVINTFHDKYMGQWLNDKMSGLGRLESAHESLEIGNFVGGKLHGYGMRVHKSRAAAVSAATVLSGAAISGAKKIFVGHFEEDEFIGIRSRADEAAFQATEALRLDKPWNPFASDKKAVPNKFGENQTPSPKRFPAMRESDFDPKIAEDVAAVVEDVLEVEGVAQIFYDRIDARCRGEGYNAGILKKPANLEDATTPENKKKWKMASGGTPLHLSRWRKFEDGVTDDLRGILDGTLASATSFFEVTATKNTKSGDSAITGEPIAPSDALQQDSGHPHTETETETETAPDLTSPPRHIQFGD